MKDFLIPQITLKRNSLLFGLMISTLILFSACSKPVADFVVIKQDDKVPTEIIFENTSKNAESYRWDFDNGNESTLMSPRERYLLSGKYDVSLTAMKGGKSDKTTKSVYLNAPDICLVEMVTTAGTMLIHLYEETPKHRDNFLKLAEEGYYEGLLFHRVIKGFMIQGGDPNSKNAPAGKPLGTGGPGYKIDAEFNKSLHHTKGALAAARQGGPINPEKKSSGSQFYIVQGKPLKLEEIESVAYRKGIDYDKETIESFQTVGGTPFLDQEYTVFGQVIDGLEIIDRIADSKTDGNDRPLTDVKIISLNIIK